jgi:anti-sigma B factor antagonist
MKEGPMLRIVTRTAGDIIILDAEGRVTVSDGTSTRLRSAFRHAASWSSKILVNLEQVTYLDSSGIGELITATTARGRQVKILHPNVYLKKVLKVNQLDRCLDLHFDEEAALNSFT